MIRIKATVSDPGKKEIEKFVRTMGKINGSYVSIGVHEDAGFYSEGANPPSVVEVALWNEFGTKDIPERSFIRSAIDEKAELIRTWQIELLGKVQSGAMTERKALEALGFRIQTLIQNKIKSNVPPENAPGTTAAKLRKGSAHPYNTLQDTDLLLRSISYRVHTR